MKWGSFGSKFWFQVSAYAAVSERADALAGRDFSWGSICVELWRCQKYHSLLCRILRTWKSRSTKKMSTFALQDAFALIPHTPAWAPPPIPPLSGENLIFFNLFNSRNQIPQQSIVLADTWIEKVRLGISFVFVTSGVAVSTTTGISKKQQQQWISSFTC